MAIKVAINGFGRIGRLTFRKLFDDKNFEIVAINDLTEPRTLAHLLKYDSAQGIFLGKNIIYKEDSIIVNDKKIRVFNQKEPNLLPWKEMDIDIVFECTGFFTTKEKCELHIEAGAKKVILSAPGTDMKTVVYNVNHSILDGTENIVSCASCTTNCLAPIAKILNNEFRIKYGLMTTIHAYTNDQNLLDAPHRKNDLRRSRAAANNIVPNTTGAAKAIGLVIPELNGKLNGSAQRVPVITGSLIELTCVLEKKVNEELINNLFKQKTNETLFYTEEEIVSGDIIGSSCGSLFDATQTKVIDSDEGQLVKVVAWYDNEMGYVSQMLRTAKYMMNL